MFHAVSFFKKQPNDNFSDAYAKFKENHLKRITNNYYAKQDGAEERKMFHLALQYAMTGSEELFLDNTEKEQITYYMTHGERKSEVKNIQDNSAEQLTEILK